MGNEKWKKLSTEELIKKEKTLTFTNGVTIGIVFFLFVTTIYSSIQNKKFDPLLVVAIACAAIIPINFKNIKAMKEEISRR